MSYHPHHLAYVGRSFRHIRLAIREHLLRADNLGDARTAVHRPHALFQSSERVDALFSWSRPLRTVFDLGKDNDRVTSTRGTVKWWQCLEIVDEPPMIDYNPAVKPETSRNGGSRSVDSDRYFSQDVT